MQHRFAVRRPAGPQFKGQSGLFHEHAEAVALGVTAVPTVVTPGGMVLPGAQDLVFYRRLVQKLRSM